MNNRALTLIDALELSPHPEGGYYKEVYRSATSVHSPHAGAMRSGLTDIYFLLVSGQVSRFHRVLHDEIWHLYEGDPLILVELCGEGLEMREICLSSRGDMPKYKHCIQAGNWQAAYSSGEYSLVGCSVAPGFDFSDFEFLSQDAVRQAAVLLKFPMLRHLL
ncbi:MAG: cupin domain-containing protein [Pseudomonadota bacterium]